jgi:hypothetical protein
MTRVIEGLRWAKLLDERPGFIPNSRPRGAKAMGLRYERALAKAMPFAKRGLWFEFCDGNGLGVCQTDFIIELERGVLVLEVKYSWVSEAHLQLEGLYLPVVSMALARRARGLVVCKNLTPNMPSDVQVIGNVVEWPEGPSRTVLHWPFVKGLGTAIGLARGRLRKREELYANA